MLKWHSYVAKMPFLCCENAILMLSNWHLRYQLHSHVLQGNRGKTEERGGMHVFEAYESRKMTPFLFFNISACIS